MKANTPEKIYLQVCGDCPQTDCESCKFEDFEDNITWCKDRIFPKDIEYTRTDAFIYKIQTELDKLYHKWFDDSTGLEVSEEGAELGALDMAYEAFQEIIDNLKDKKQ